MKLEKNKTYGFEALEGVSRHWLVNQLEELLWDYCLEQGVDECRYNNHCETINYLLHNEFAVCGGIVINTRGRSTNELSVMWVEEGHYHDGHIESNWPWVQHIKLREYEIQPIMSRTRLSGAFELVWDHNMSQ